MPITNGFSLAFSIKTLSSFQHSTASATAFDLPSSLCGPSLPSMFVFFQTNSQPVPKHTLLTFPLGGLCFCSGLGSGGPPPYYTRLCLQETCIAFWAHIKMTAHPKSFQKTSYLPAQKTVASEYSLTIPVANTDNESDFLITIIWRMEWNGGSVIFKFLMLLIPDSYGQPFWVTGIPFSK